MRKRPLFLGACVFLIGLVYKKYQASELILVLLAIIGVEIFYGIRWKRKKTMAKRSILLFLAFLVGAFHMNYEEEFRNSYLSKISDGDEVTIWGEISKIEDTDYGIRIYLSDCYVSLDNGITPCNDIMVYASTTDYQVGEIQKITGKFNNFSSATNEGNFDSRIFYQSQKIDFSVTAETSEVVGFQKNYFRDSLLSLKSRMKDVYDACLEEISAGFYVGMILGDKSNLDETLKSLFAEGGIAHILAISGLHVSMVGRSIYKFLRKRGVGFLVAGVGAQVAVFAYCFMSGNGMSAVRATVMLLLYFIAQYIGRSYDMLNALGAAGVYLLWKNPFLVEYSGFWFSVMALVGIGFVSDTLSWKTKYTSGLWTSIGISLTTMPITALCYFEIPLYSVFVNAIVLPILTPVFCLALLGGLIGVVLPEIASIWLIPCHWALILFQGICELITSLPGAILLTGKPSIERVVLYYMVLVLSVWGLWYFKKKWIEQSQEKKKLPKRYHLSKVLLGIICFLILIFPNEKEFEISFLDVGQGDGIYFCMPNGSTCFIDGGSSDVNEVGTNRILPFLMSKQIGKIDYWFVSHADTDHISGLKEVLESGYEVSYLILPRAAPKDETLQELITIAGMNKTKVLYMSAGDYVEEENWRIQCLYPGNEDMADKNEASLVLSLWTQITTSEKEQEFVALFSGDISSEVEYDLVGSEGLRDVCLYKAAHHGSRYSNSQEILSEITPEIVVISCGQYNSYGHPHQETLERLNAADCKIWQTKDGGQITIKISKEKIGVYEFRK